MLKPINPEEAVNKGQRVTYPPPPPRTCEACGNVVPVGHDAINCIIAVGSPGHPDLYPFQCASEEHWACSVECWRAVAHACIDEHMQPLLKYHRNKVGL